MPIGLIIEWPGATQQQYDDLMDQLDFRGVLPPGELLHAAGPIPGGWRIIDIWETRQDFDRLVTEKLGDALQSVGVNDAQITEFPIHNILR